MTQLANGISIGSAVYACTAAKPLNAFQWGRQSPKLPLLFGGSGPHSVHGSLGPPESDSLPNGISIGLLCLHSLPVCPTDRQTHTHTHIHTDHATCVTCHNNVHLVQWPWCCHVK